MNIVKVTNKIALVSVVGLMYWVFIFVCSTVFGFKVFRENMTEMFLLSILGIFAILSGSIILNIMFNLTAIAEGNRDVETKKSNATRPAVIFISSLLVIFLGLYFGDMATTKKKETYLVSSASDLVTEQSDVMSRLSNYSFTREYLESTSQDIKILNKVEEKFPSITVIVRDYINDKSYLLGFGGYIYLNDDKEPQKSNYILSTSSEERKYLNSVFSGENKKHWFSSSDGRYEMYFPVKTEHGVIVLHLSQRSRYGKIGS
jgi:hypothetical protein